MKWITCTAIEASKPYVIGHRRSGGERAIVKGGLWQ
jgi:hypothetical protein